MDQDSPEIWSEYFRIKNRLMDYDENLREAVANIRMLMRLGQSAARQNQHFAKAQKHVGLVLDLGLACGAIRARSDPERLAHVKAVAAGQWRSIADFERCQEYFREEYQATRFYDVTVKNDARPGVVQKYGGSSR